MRPGRAQLRPLLLPLLLAAPAGGGVVSISLPGVHSETCFGGITETDVRAGGRAVIVSLKGDTWKHPDFAPYRDSVVWGLSSTGEAAEPAGFAARRDTLLPRDNVVVDIRRNDFTDLALLLNADPLFDIRKDEQVFVEVPANATTSGTRPTLAGTDGSGALPSFTVCAAQSVVKAPAVIFEAQVRGGVPPIEINLFLTNGEQFVQRNQLAIEELIRNFRSSLENAQGEPDNFVARRAALLRPLRFEPIAPGFDQLRITLDSDPSYNFYTTREVINMTIPRSLIVSGFEPTPALGGLGFVIGNSPGQAWIEGIGGTGAGQSLELTEDEIRKGTAGITVALKHDKWTLTPDTPLDQWIPFFTSQEVQLGQWELRRDQILSANSFELLDQQPGTAGAGFQLQRLRINFRADPGYSLPPGLLAESVIFPIPTYTVMSRLPPTSATGAGVAVLEFKIKAMGSVEMLNRQLLPRNSGDIFGSASALDTTMRLDVRLQKDKWLPEMCRPVLRNAFNSTLSRQAAPLGFLAKIDSIVNPGGVTFSRCDAVTDPCTMSITLVRAQSYTLAPADPTVPPRPETVWLTVPPRCVGLGIVPAGDVSFRIDVHPSEVRFNTISASASGTTRTVYAGRDFAVELYYSSDAWLEYTLVQGIDCTDPEARSITAAAACRCGAPCPCATEVTGPLFTNATKVEFRKPAEAGGEAQQVFTDVGSWSVCVKLMTQKGNVVTRVHSPIPVEQDPATIEPPAEAGIGADINAQIVVIGALFTICFTVGISWGVRSIIISHKESEQAQRKNNKGNALFSVASELRGGAHGIEEEETEFQAFARKSGWVPLTRRRHDEAPLLDPEELPEIDARAPRFAFAVHGEDDPNVQRLLDLPGKAYRETLVGQKRRLVEIGMADSDCDDSQTGGQEDYDPDEESDESAEEYAEPHGDPFAGAHHQWFATGPGQQRPPGGGRNEELFGSDSEDGYPAGAAAPAPPPRQQQPVMLGQGISVTMPTQARLTTRTPPGGEAGK
eukprot:TRINITY_DN50036_c0_g1_i1.p1 TRINITY_DN50036_c0_g1~~TRINITY_DN50036_c0_g1_i1.p1  ORF type:complete len:1032 (+),score=370.78 TRINITY_DN50036_c0_g1_i1:67-3096(+)